jgi:hypothetical protein
MLLMCSSIDNQVASCPVTNYKLNMFVVFLSPSTKFHVRFPLRVLFTESAVK